MPLKRQKAPGALQQQVRAPAPTYQFMSDEITRLDRRDADQRDFYHVHQFADLGDFRRNYFNIIRRSLCTATGSARFSIQPLLDLRQFTVPRAGSQCDSCFRRISDDCEQDVDCIMDQLAELNPALQVPDRFEISESFSNFEQERQRDRKPNSVLFDIEENSSFDIVKPITENRAVNKIVLDMAEDPFFEVTPLENAPPSGDSPLLELGDLCQRDQQTTSESSEAFDKHPVLCRQPMSAKALGAVSRGLRNQFHSVQRVKDDAPQKPAKIVDFQTIDFAALDDEQEEAQRGSCDAITKNTSFTRSLKSAQTSGRSEGQQRKVKGILKKDK